MVNANAELEKIKEYAEENNVPIMTEEGINFLTNYIKKHNIKKILEIGAAIGFSAIIEGVEDPYSLGYSLRTLYACGCDSVILPRHLPSAADSTLCKASVNSRVST